MKQQTLVTKIILGLILTFSLFLYTFKIVDNPPSLYSDESDVSYQAFIFNHYFSDYFGNKLPVHFHSFSDWQPGFYIYSVAFIQKFIGHVDLAVRLPAAIFGTLTILVFYLLINIIIKNQVWALIGAFLLTLSPWLTHYSRTGFAVTAMLFFLLLGIYFWLKFTNDSKNNFLYLSLISFSLSLYTYSTSKLYLIFVFLILFCLWFKKINDLPLKTKLIGLFLIIIISLPIFIDTAKGKAGYRFSYINIFSDPTVSKTVNNSRLEDSIKTYENDQIGIKPTLVSKVFHNKISLWSEMFLKNYFSSFSTEFLFLEGDGNLRQGFKNAGYLLFPDLLFIIIGLASVLNIKTKSVSKPFLLFFLCLICAPIPFALTRDSLFPHGTRLIVMLPFLIFFSLLGLKQLYTFTKSKLIIFFVFVIYIFCFVNFIHQYFVHYPNLSARDWHYGMKDIVLNSYQDQNNWQTIYYSDSYEPFTPFFLNYAEITPVPSIKRGDSNYFTGILINDKFYLGHIEWPSLIASRPSSKTLFIATDEDLIKIKNDLNDFNRNNPKPVNYYIVKKFDKKYFQQVQFYLITFDSTQ